MASVAQHESLRDALSVWYEKAKRPFEEVAFGLPLATPFSPNRHAMAASESERLSLKTKSHG